MGIPDIKHFSVIFNPIAGKGNALKKLPNIQKFLEDNNLKFKIYITERIGHAIELAAELCKIPNTATIAAGGDGTVNEVINGLMHAKDKKPEITPVFGVLPIGRGNDFAFGAGVPAILEDCLTALIDVDTQPIDIGLIKGGDYPSGRYFGNGIGVGFDTIVGLEAAKMKHIHGAAGYMIGALKTLITYPSAPEIEMEINGEKGVYTPALVSIMNGRRMGGAFFMAPDGKNNDGFLNLCMTQQGTRLKLLQTMFHYTKGTQGELENTKTALISAITFTAIKGEMAVHADGETICEKGKLLEISCIPNALNIIKVV
ncbi:MAG: YegS/Rv2252/BmrU family lipid kinase [Candidatus Cloacimonetes bacterium]|jgi:diacylglycerol kinase (ATP)|nr:YegS/Rv2252/BmrU family lipid kinase [Candidatus Cloacimonadota bacterium]